MGDIDASWCPLGWVSPEIPGGAGDNVIHYYFIPKPQMQMVYSSFFLLKSFGTFKLFSSGRGFWFLN